MSSNTTNFNLHKIDLTDAPPDITVLNQNWDALDSLIFNVPKVDILSTTSITSAALDQRDSTVKHYAFSGDSYTGGDLPSYGHRFGNATVFKRYNFITILLWGAPTATQLAVKYYNATTETWSDWQLLYDTDNPPTFNEINAAPAGFGLGEVAKDISNMELVSSVVGKSGFYRGTNVTNAPDQYWWYYVVSAGVDTTMVVAFTSRRDDIYKATITSSDTTVTWTTFGADKDHTHPASDIQEGVFPTTNIKAATGTDYTTGRVRNIWATPNDLTAGTSELASGNICLVYE